MIGTNSRMGKWEESSSFETWSGEESTHASVMSSLATFKI